MLNERLKAIDREFAQLRAGKAEEYRQMSMLQRFQLRRQYRAICAQIDADHRSARALAIKLLDIERA
jgi:hypothetical protein